MKTQCCLSIALLILVGSWGTDVFAQAECAAGGNLRGIRVDGELMAFIASIRAVEEALARSLSGAFSPAAAFGADFVLTIPDTSRTDTIPQAPLAGRP